MERFKPLQLLNSVERLDEQVDQNLAEAVWEKMFQLNSATLTFRLDDSYVLDLQDMPLSSEDEADGVREMAITLRHGDDGYDSPENKAVYLRFREGLWKIEISQDIDESAVNSFLEVIKRSEALSPEAEVAEAAQRTVDRLRAIGFSGEGEA